MTELQALDELEAMTDTEFNTFLQSLPSRVRILIHGVVDWRTVLPEWYIKSKELTV